MDVREQADVLIITGLEKERSAVLRHLHAVEEVPRRGRTFHKGYLHSEGTDQNASVVVIALPKMGNVHAAATTMQAIMLWSPTYLFVVGIAASSKKAERWLGDVLIGEQIVGYDYAKVRDGKTDRRYQVYRPALKLIEAARTLPPEQWAFTLQAPRPDGTSGRVNPIVHFGAVLSGEKVVASEALMQELRSDWSEMVGLEMEALGAAVAAYTVETAPATLMVKGICDWGDGEKNDQWQAYAADVAASFATALLRSITIAPSQVQTNSDKNDGASKQQGSITIEPKQMQAELITPISYPGKIKFEFGRRLGKDWLDLAMLLEIPQYVQSRWKQGEEAYAIWEYLESRNQLALLKVALIDINRKDLADLL